MNNCHSRGVSDQHDRRFDDAKTDIKDRGQSSAFLMMLSRMTTQ